MPGVPYLGVELVAPTLEYVCTNCSKSVERDNLTVKKVAFAEMGVGGKIIRSRVIGWLCVDCLTSDVDWNREAFQLQRSIPGGELNAL